MLHYIPDLGRGGAETQLFNNVRYSDPERFHHVVCFGGPPTDHVAGLEELGVEVVEVGKGTRPWSIRPALEIRKVIRRRKIDLMHVGLFPTRFGLLAAISTKTPVVTTIPNTFGNADLEAARVSFVGRSKRVLGIKLQAWLARFGSDRFIAISNAVKDDAIRALGFPADRTDIVYRGLIPERFDPTAVDSGTIRNDLELTDAHPILLNVARLAPQKAQSDLLHMMMHVRKEFPGAHLLICGIGPLREQLEEERNRLGLKGAVSFLGFRNDALELLQMADVSVFSSLYEGLCNAVVEASAAGTPVVAYDIPVFREIVENGASGVLTEERSPELLADGVIRVVSNPVLASRMAKRGRQIVRERFDIRKNVLLTQDVYDRVLATPRQAISLGSASD